MPIKVYYTSTASSSKLEGNQRKIDMILTAKKIEFEKLDVASSEENKKKMRELMGDDKAVAPQIFNDDQYCGNFEKFEEANESDTLKEFLKLE
ncbi:SH3 domain-binding glutamic acid-rich-like protein 3 [Holothuria leucospilota]|uniref:SH3 domain-binding glutamic acid-rich-like protein n=1 Tax=Holothuria leucospilota TaxID=206669 RepID=A0A9Q0YRG2_HOLLE|nr:SH3 domain-binding glutamic acid-rich-like protein 3 [Holothuria leucospilota]